VRLTERPDEIACTNFYLNDEEWDVLVALPARTLRKKRHMVARDEWLVAIDELEDGTLVAEIDDRDEPSDRVPDWLEVVSDVTRDEAWTGGRLARQRRSSSRASWCCSAVQQRGTHRRAPQV
jgi:CYTH domain-containing protein